MEAEGPVSASDTVKCVEWLSGFAAARKTLVALMKERNVEGYTPFMAATAYKVCCVSVAWTGCQHFSSPYSPMVLLSSCLT